MPFLDTFNKFTFETSFTFTAGSKGTLVIPYLLISISALRKFLSGIITTFSWQNASPTRKMANNNMSGFPFFITKKFN